MSAAAGTTPSVLTRSKEDLPHPNSKKAPKTFTGRHTEVDSFLTEFVEMTNLYNVPTLGRFDVITRYVSRSVAEVMEGLPEYHAKNWIDFVTQMKDLYNHVKVEKRYSAHDLDTFVADKTHKFIQNLSKFRKYQRGFFRIGGWLLQHQKITEDQFRKAFWMGLPLHVRNRLENRMLQVTPTLSVSKPFPIDLVIKAAEHIYDPSRFDREKEEAVSDDDSDDTDKVDYSDSEEEEEYASSEEEEEDQGTQDEGD